MRIWYFNQHTGELQASKDEDKGCDAQESPREPGKYIESIYCTKIAPPETGNNQVAVFNGTAWEIKSDYRTIIAWYKSTGERVSITEIGVEPDGEYTTIAPEGFIFPKFDNGIWREKTEKEKSAEVYAEDRDKAVTALRHQCELLLDSKYYRHEIAYKGKHVRADIDSQKIITGYLAEISIGSRSYPLYWITCENDMITIDNQSEMISMVSQMSAWIEQSIFACRTAKTAIDNAVDFEGSWVAFIAFRDAEI